jgi:hypothetical protein
LERCPSWNSGKRWNRGLAGGEAEHGVSQKLEHFVIAAGAPTARAQRLHLARLRAVGKRLLEQFPALEAVTQAFFQRHDFA